MKISTTKLTHQIQKEVKKLNPELKITFGDSFAFFYATDTITYHPFNNEPESAEALAKHIESTRNFDIRPHFFMYSLLHEIGHSFTMDNLESEDLDNELYVRELIHLVSQDNTTDADEMYFNLESEMLANDWAVNFIQNNVPYCVKLENRLQKYLNHFYKRLG